MVVFSAIAEDKSSFLTNKFTSPCRAGRSKARPVPCKKVSTKTISIVAISSETRMPKRRASNPEATME